MINTVGLSTQKTLEKLHCSFSKITKNVRLLIYRVLESLRDLRSFYGTQSFSETSKICDFYGNISLLRDPTK